MALDAFKTKLRQKIARGGSRIKEVFQELQQAPIHLPEEQLNQLTIIQGEWEEYRSKKIKGLYYPGQAETAHARITDKLLSLITELGKGKEVPTKARHITFLSANPGRSAQLRLDVEFREIQSILNASLHRDEFSLTSRLASRVRDLYDVLLKEKPHILHFAGHGDLSLDEEGKNSQRGLNWEHPESHSKRFSTGIALIDGSDDDEAVILPPETLGNLFSHFSDHLQCVLLNACYSEGQFDTLSKHVPYVIGMKTAISDRFAIDFSRGFYQALGEGRTIPEAYSLAKAYLQAENWEEAEVVQMISQS